MAEVNHTQDSYFSAGCLLVISLQSRLWPAVTSVSHGRSTGCFLYRLCALSWKKMSAGCPCVPRFSISDQAEQGSCVPVVTAAPGRSHVCSKANRKQQTGRRLTFLQNRLVFFTISGRFPPESWDGLQRTPAPQGWISRHRKGMEGFLGDSAVFPECIFSRELSPHTHTHIHTHTHTHTHTHPALTQQDFTFA